jgi:hypothetical protein
MSRADRITTTAAALAALALFVLHITGSLPAGTPPATPTPTSM